MRTFSNIKRFISYYKPHRALFAADMLCSLLFAGCDLVYPMLTRKIINVYIPQKQMKVMVIWCAALLGIYLLKLMFNYFILYYGHLVGVRMQADMRRDIFAHLQKLPFTFFDNNKTGSIMSRIINDLMEISELAHHGPENLLLSFIMLCGSFVILSFINVQLTLIIFAFIPFLVYFSMKKRIKLKRAFDETRQEVSEINANVENSISGVRVAKAFTNSRHETLKFKTFNDRFKRSRGKAYKVMAEFHSVNNFILDFLNVVVLTTGGLFIFYGHITFGDFVAYLLYISMFTTPIKRLIEFVEQWQYGMSGFERFCQIIDEQTETESESALELESVKGDIEYQNVSFSYDEGKQVLSGIDIKIYAGQIVALVGTSGGGKTTLCHLLPRFYEPTDGKILLDGKDISIYKKDSLRKKIGIVSQDVFLFTDSIYENIVYGSPGAARGQVIEAAKKAGIHDYIASLPDGYETLVGERGIKLSGGQKQRIAIARVFLKNPPILILDEATSALDNVTEAYIQKSLFDLARGRTAIIVAHRLSTVKNADEIIVMTDEGIVQRGSHEALMDEGGIYRTLYDAQFKE